MKLKSFTSYDFPDSKGHFGPYGGSFVSETLFAALEKLDQDYSVAINDRKFLDKFEKELKTFVGRPSPIFHAQRWSEKIGGGQLYFKREDLNHTGAHKINNTIGQVLLAKRTGKKRVIAGTDCGFGTFAGFGNVDPDIAYLKLQSLVQGASKVK